MSTSRREMLKAIFAVPVGLVAGERTVKDGMADQQRVLDSLYRQMLDNLYMQNHPTTVFTDSRMFRTEVVGQRVEWSVLNEADVWDLNDLADELEEAP